MKRFKLWLMEKFLPAWAKEEWKNELEGLREKVRQKDVEIERLRSYIEGMHDALRYQKKIVINSGEK